MVSNYCGCSRGRRRPQPKSPVEECGCGCGEIVINNNLINGPGVVTNPANNTSGRRF
ncbi:hypothetical protein [Geomicrobium sediminis]|uniref:Uncharacterized protein n=1 Tax=Geomicrobium sediminis TaxID=1347788 RepID=A0ABS2P7Z1_9BACL|nr:hypothetical protein [Geomicrobium sediminis]MBM7631481.1 hypothetical protein [Geomicrobium sediminis]